MDIIDEPADPFAIKQLVSLDSYLKNCPTPKEVQYQQNNNERETSVRKSSEP
ncbi:hypothetical protein BDF20DRAFT_868768 [Mycotypha africana]|uniref:uncharacterized protein n=1 Tax=Mycotypha africana TaxID=64632 RepID=UPI002301194A|nr:uncharacterized protein BDF20DRAFT_868768 [Mycotypha africana]KAI8979306.1 hypothetical protein BDF20DRAFT_868768 [Mycotypha africana]